MVNKRISIIHCFDDNYVVPAAVAFKTMLQHADKTRSYDLYVVTDSVALRNKRRLKKIVECFNNAQLTFVPPPKDYAGLFNDVRNKAHFSKEIIYKLLLPEMFPNVDKAIVTDVDCLYLGDISQPFDSLSTEDTNLLGGINYSGLPCRWSDKFTHNYQGYSAQEKECLHQGVGAGFMVYDMALMRREGVSKKLMAFFAKNAARLIQPEQDVLNIVCQSRILRLPPRDMVCTYLYDVLDPDEIQSWHEVLTSPIQLHYATGIKPWKYPFCTKSFLWWRGLIGTGFLIESLFTCMRFQMSEFLEKVCRRIGILIGKK